MTRGQRQEREEWNNTAKFTMDAKDETGNNRPTHLLTSIYTHTLYTPVLVLISYHPDI
jgi:hypothetical protein